MLTAREARGTIRNKGVLYARMGMSTFIAGLYAWLYAGSGSAGDSSTGGNCVGTSTSTTYNAGSCAGDFQAHFGLLVALAITAMMGSAQPVLLTFPAERPVFLRE